MKNRLKEVRLKKGLTQQDVAVKASLSLTQFRNIETSRSIPSVFVALRIKKALNCKYLEEIFTIDD